MFCVHLQDVDRNLWAGAENNVRLHLEKLCQEKKVQKCSNHDITEWILVSKL